MDLEKDIDKMRITYIHARDASKDPRTNTGALIVNNGYMIGCGVNTTPYNLNFEEFMGESENKRYYLNHAEKKAIACCARNGKSTLGATMYTPWEPCSHCGLMIIDSGISELVLHKQLNDYYRVNMADDKWLKDQDMALKIMKQAGVNVRYLDAKLFQDEENIFINFRGEKFYP